MYECPNCGGGFRFDIETQLLKCDHCDTTMDPYAYEKDHDAEKTTEYEVTRFSCPQCGAEIIGTDNAAAAFCSFCGASTILNSHLTKEKKPDYIIPFKMTKKACKDAYQARLKKAFFAPKELKDPTYIDHFRGIYMPYWLYKVTQRGHVQMHGETSHRSGDYIITSHYALDCDLDANYRGLAYDSASTFDDTISEEIAPFNESEMKQFTPSMLCGFYADVADVNKDLYAEDAKSFANRHSNNLITTQPQFAGKGLKSLPDNVLGNAVNTKVDKTENAMFPVWFLSYERNGRVAYATVNGQNGKMSIDIPIDPKKFIITSLLLAIPIFLLFNILFTFTAKTALVLAGIFALIATFIHIAESKSIIAKENHDSDRGFLSLHQTSTNDASKDTPSKKSAYGVGWLPSFLGLIAAVAIFLLHPVSDLPYYITVVGIGIVILITLISVIKRYNLLSTRPLPQFNRTGGDDDAN